MARQITTAIAAGVAIITLVLGVVIGFVAYPYVIGPAPAPGPAGLTGEIKIGSLQPLSGDLATYGQNSKVAIEFAAEEVNDFLEESGANWTLKIVTEDTETKPDVCLTKLETLAAQGIKLVVGPMSSGELSNIKGYADANKILVISQSSTAPALGIAGDYIFRFCPNDMWQGRAMARVIYEDGIRYVAAVWRGDAWGDGLENQTEIRFEALGGTFIEGAKIRYTPGLTTYSTEVASLASAVASAVTTYGADKVAVYDIAFEEVTLFLTAATTYPVLRSVKWYGSDGTTLSQAMLDDPVSAEFSNATKFNNPIFTPLRSEKYDRVVARVNQVLNRTPDAYSFPIYDAIWALVYSLMSVNRYDAEAVRAVLPDVTASLFGASGWTKLDANGDRSPTDYDLWVITWEAGAYTWKLIGRWNLDTDTVTWL